MRLNITMSLGAPPASFPRDARAHVQWFEMHASSSRARPVLQPLPPLRASERTRMG